MIDLTGSDEEEKVKIKHPVDLTGSKNKVELKRPLDFYEDGEDWKILYQLFGGQSVCIEEKNPSWLHLSDLACFFSPAHYRSPRQNATGEFFFKRFPQCKKLPFDRPKPAFKVLDYTRVDGEKVEAVEVCITAAEYTNKAMGVSYTTNTFFNIGHDPNTKEIFIDAIPNKTSEVVDEFLCTTPQVREFLRAEVRKIKSSTEYLENPIKCAKRLNALNNRIY